MSNEHEPLKWETVKSIPVNGSPDTTMRRARVPGGYLVCDSPYGGPGAMCFVPCEMWVVEIVEQRRDMPRGALPR